MRAPAQKKGGARSRGQQLSGNITPWHVSRIEATPAVRQHKARHAGADRSSRLHALATLRRAPCALLPLAAYHQLALLLVTQILPNQKRGGGHSHGGPASAKTVACRVLESQAYPVHSFHALCSPLHSSLLHCTEAAWRQGEWGKQGISRLLSLGCQGCRGGRPARDLRRTHASALAGGANRGQARRQRVG